MKKLLLIALILMAGFGLDSRANDIFKELENRSIHTNYEGLKKPIIRNLDQYYRRAYPFEKIPEGAYQNAIRQMEQMIGKNKKSSTYIQSLQNEWRTIGPGNISGRIKSIVIHPTNPDIIYIGAASGGIWKTTNGGNNWEALFDYENSIAMGALAMDYSNPDILYAFTGEAVAGGSIVAGSGVYKTYDGGRTWEHIGLSTVTAFNKAYVHPTNSNLLYACAIGRDNGVYSSTDAGATWFRYMVGNNVTDLAINTSNPNELIIGVSGSGIYKSENGGVSFRLLVDNTLGGFDINQQVGRVSVQGSPNLQTLYSLIESGEERLGAIYKSINGGQSWFKIYQGDASFFNGQGYYDNYIGVDPSNPNNVLAGGIDSWLSTNGINFVNQTNGYQGGSVHVDHHAIAYAPSNPSMVFLATDGGLYKSTNNGRAWTFISNGLYITQFYHLGVDSKHAEFTYGGTQDNGTLGNRLGRNNWNNILGGDGFVTRVAPWNSDWVYAESQYGNMARLDFSIGGQSVALNNGIPRGTAANAPFDTPFVIDGQNRYIYQGRDAVWANYGSGTARWDMLTEPRSNFCSAVEVSKANPDNLWVGYRDGYLINSSEGGFSWEVVNKGLPNRFISSITASSIDPETAYLTLGGYGTEHVFKTTDFGKTWFSVSKLLPDVSTNNLVISPLDPNHLYVATDIGVFVTYDDGLTWAPFGRGLPRSPVTELEFHTGRDVLPAWTLRAATYGRSIWEIEIPAAPVSEAEIVSPGGGEVWVGGNTYPINWYGFEGPVKLEFSPNDGQEWSELGQNLVGNSFLWVAWNTDTYKARFKVSSISNPSQVVISRAITIQRRKKGSTLISANVPHVPYGLAVDADGKLWSTSFYGNTVTRHNPDNLTTEMEYTLRGDSLYTDITFNKSNGNFFVHRLLSTGTNGGMVEEYTKDGNFVRDWLSVATKYPMGLHHDGDELTVVDRESPYEVYVTSDKGRDVKRKFVNFCKYFAGPRGITADNEFYYHICTDFSGGGFAGGYIMKIDKSFGSLIDQIPIEFGASLVNARGVEYDVRDENLWVTDFSGNIYKIAGFNTITTVKENLANEAKANLFPNPASEYSMLSLDMTGQKGGLATIEVFDMFGQSVKRVFKGTFADSDIRNFEIKTNDLASGNYNVVVTIDGLVNQVTKLVVVR